MKIHYFSLILHENLLISITHCIDKQLSWIFTTSNGFLGNLGVYLIHPLKLCAGLTEGNPASGIATSGSQVTSEESSGRHAARPVPDATRHESHIRDGRSGLCEARASNWSRMQASLPLAVDAQRTKT